MTGLNTSSGEGFHCVPSLFSVSGANRITPGKPLAIRARRSDPWVTAMSGEQENLK